MDLLVTIKRFTVYSCTFPRGRLPKKKKRGDFLHSSFHVTKFRNTSVGRTQNRWPIKILLIGTCGVETGKDGRWCILAPQTRSPDRLCPSRASGPGRVTSSPIQPAAAPCTISSFREISKPCNEVGVISSPDPQMAWSYCCFGGAAPDKFILVFHYHPYLLTSGEERRTLVCADGPTYRVAVLESPDQKEEDVSPVTKSVFKWEKGLPFLQGFR